MFDVDSLSDAEVIARTLWAEARSQGVTGMVAVANVIENRAANPGWWGHDLRSVCLAPKQFSCWNESDPQADKIRAEAIPGDLYQQAFALAQACILGVLVDMVHGADHYLAEYVYPMPKWASGQPIFICGEAPERHLFYKLGLSG